MTSTTSGGRLPHGFHARHLSLILPPLPLLPRLTTEYIAHAQLRPLTNARERREALHTLNDNPSPVLSYIHDISTPLLIERLRTVHLPLLHAHSPRCTDNWCNWVTSTHFTSREHYASFVIPPSSHPLTGAIYARITVRTTMT